MAANLTHERKESSVWTMRDDRQREADIVATITDPAIGELCRNGKTVYYVILNGVRRERQHLYTIAALLLDHRNGGRVDANGRPAPEGR